MAKKNAGSKSKSSSKPKVSQPVKDYVNKMIATKQENKEAMPVIANDVDILPYGQQTTHSFTTLNLNQIFQGISQGTLNGQRIGDAIHAKKLRFSGFINWDSSKLEQNMYRHLPMYVKMFVFRRKDSLDSPATYSGIMGVGENDILMNGPSATSPINKLSDFNKPFNKDVYKIYKTKIFKLGPAAVGDTPNSSGQWNNDFKFSQRFDIDLSKHVNNITYAEGQNYQTNCAFYVGFLVSFGNNSNIDASAKPPVEIHYTVNLTYEDA